MSVTTKEWMDAAGIDPLEGPARTAELLVASAHRCVDWDIWGGSRRLRYWDALAEAVREHAGLHYSVATTLLTRTYDDIGARSEERRVGKECRL